MKKTIFAIFFTLFCSVNFSLFCDSQDIVNQMTEMYKEIESFTNGSGQNGNNLKNAILKTNLKFLEKKVTKKLKHAESQLEKQQLSLNDTSNDREAQQLLKKIESTQKTIQNLNEALSTMHTWKEKLS